MDINNIGNKIIQSINKDNIPYNFQKIEKNKKDDNLDKKEVKDIPKILSIVKEINKNIEQQGVTFSYSQDKDTGVTIIQLKDMETNEVIKQIPSKDMLEVAENINNYLKNYTNSGLVPSGKLVNLINNKI